MVTVPPLSLRQTIFDWYAETRKARVLLLKRVDGPEQWVSSVWDPQLRRSAASSYSDTALATGRRSTTDVTCETRTSVSSPQHMAFASTAPLRGVSTRDTRMSSVLRRCPNSLATPYAAMPKPGSRTQPHRSELGMAFTSTTDTRRLRQGWLSLK